MKRMKKRIFAGAVCEQVVYNASDRAPDPKKAKPQLRFKSEEERLEHRKGIALRKLIRKINANFTPAGYFCTLTLSAENEIHDYDTARVVRANLTRRLLYKFKDARIVIVMGRGHSTARIHYHMLIEAESLTPEDIRAAWHDGDVIRIDHLREHNKLNGVDVGRDYTQVAVYMFNHWTPEQGGHYCYQSRNMVLPDEEQPRECVREYSPERPPVEPKGFRYLSCIWNKYGYMVFKYIKEETKEKPRRGGCK